MSGKDMSDTNHLVGSPEAEIRIDEPLVRSLLRDQVPELADLPLEFLLIRIDPPVFHRSKNGRYYSRCRECPRCRPESK